MCQVWIIDIKNKESSTWEGSLDYDATDLSSFNSLLDPLLNDCRMLPDGSDFYTGNHQSKHQLRLFLFDFFHPTLESLRKGVTSITNMCLKMR